VSRRCEVIGEINFVVILPDLISCEVAANCEVIKRKVDCCVKLIIILAFLHSSFSHRYS